MGDMGPRPPGTRLVGTAWPRMGDGRMSLLAELSLNKQELEIDSVDKQEEGKT